MTGSVTSIVRARAAARRRSEARARNSRTAVLVMVVAAILLVIGLGATLSASSVVGLVLHGDGLIFFKKQLLWAVIGSGVMLVAVRTPYQLYQRLALPIFAVAVAGLVAVLAFGEVRGGSRRWLDLGPVSLQPSEFAKFATVVFLAAVIVKKERWLGDFGHFLAPVVASVGTVSVLVMLQPDLGTTLIVAAAGMAVLVASAAPLRYVFITTVGGALIGGVLALSETYRRSRVLSYLDPFGDRLGDGYQVVQSYLALGTGGFFGVGLGASRARWAYLPNAHTDFIFAIIGEETGFLGGLVILVLFAVLTVVGLSIAARARDRFGRLLATGIVAWIAFQALVNIGGVVGVLPVTGIALPFVSFGGSALLTVLGATGVLVNIAQQGVPGRRR